LSGKIQTACAVCVQVRKFKAINTGSLGVSFVMDNKAMEKSGFTVSPNKVPVLAGAPTNAALELIVTLQVSCYWQRELQHYQPRWPYGMSAAMLLLLPLSALFTTNGH